MNPIPVKARYTAAELAALGLEGLPGSKQKLHEKALREGWSFLESQGRGGVRREYEPPVAVMAAIQAKAAAQLVAQVDSLLAPVASATALAVRQAGTALAKAEVKVECLTSKQRACADARCALVMRVLELTAVMGKDKAVRYLVDAALARSLPEHLQALVPVANAKANAERGFSRRTVYTWMALFEQAESPNERLRLLAPGKPAKDMSTPDWGALFLKLYLRPQKPSVIEAHQALRQTLDGVAVPSEHQVRRWLAKLPATLLARGRNTGAALAAKMPYVRQDWECLLPNDVWVGDGHCMKLKVAHPDHGKAFRPEVTLIVDAHSRLCVGWSVSLSENVIAVSDALRYGVERHGVPLIYYSDNGGGQKNKTLDAPVTGILGRLGVHHMTGRPGNPQGRGLVERLHQTLLIRLANSYATSQTAQMDNEAKRRLNVAIESAQNALAKGKELSKEHERALGKLPSWAEFLDALRAAVDWYNREHEHSSLPKNPATNRHYTPQAYWDVKLKRDEQHGLDREVVQVMFRPMVERKVVRGVVRVLGNHYYAPALAALPEREQDAVLVEYDIHDGRYVTVRLKTGEMVCVAELDGNKRPTFLSAAEKAGAERKQRRLALVDKKREEIEAEARGTLQLEATPAFSLEGLNPLTAMPLAPLAVQPVMHDAAELLPQLRAEGPAVLRAEAEPEGPMQRYRRWQALDRRQDGGAVLEGQDWEFWKGYRRTSEFEAMVELHADFGSAALA